MWCQRLSGIFFQLMPELSPNFLTSEHSAGPRTYYLIEQSILNQVYFHFRQAYSLHKIPVLLFWNASNEFLSWLLGLYGKSLTLSNSRWKGFTTSYNKPVQTRLSKEDNTLTQCRIDEVEFGPKVCGLIRTLAFYV